MVTQPIHDDQLARLTDSGHEIVSVRSPRGLSERELLEAATDADALLCQLTDTVTRTFFEASRVKHVATMAAGYDNIDVAAAADRGILVTNTPGVLTDATADLAIALMLGAARHLAWGDTAVRQNTAGPWRLLADPMGTDVTGATLGVIGMGRIGHATAAKAFHGFGMRILYTARNPKPEAEADLRAERVDLEDLLRRSDVVSLHAPATPETHHLIDEAALALMKPSALLVNTGRGSLVDEAALGRALQHGVLAGAGLDVLENEPEAHPELLAAGHRVLLTPHVGSATVRTRHAMSTMAVDEVLTVLSGGAPLHPVPGGKMEP